MHPVSFFQFQFSFSGWPLSIWPSSALDSQQARFAARPVPAVPADPQQLERVEILPRDPALQRAPVRVHSSLLVLLATVPQRCAESPSGGLGMVTLDQFRRAATPLMAVLRPAEGAYPPAWAPHPDTSFALGVVGQTV